MFVGEGLGFLWPYLAGFPMNKIAVIDSACAMRPGQPKLPWAVPQPKQLKLKLMQVHPCPQVQLDLAHQNELQVDDAVSTSKLLLCLAVLAACLSGMSRCRGAFDHMVCML